MAKIVVAKDKVDGSDTHKFNGTAPPPPPSGTPILAGSGDYDYKGEVSTGLSTFVAVDGKALAVLSSGSKLRADGAAAHEAPNATTFTPQPDPTKPITFVVAAGVGDGKPSAGAGSTLLTIGGVKALLDGDKFDTCGVGTKTASVAASGQDWVTSA